MHRMNENQKRLAAFAVMLHDHACRKLTANT